MLDTALAQLPVAASLISGVRFGRWSLDRLVEAAADTQREFGSVGLAGADVVSGPPLDDATRQDVQLRRFRTQASRAARETDYYGRLFDRVGLDPARLRAEDIARVPPTTKDALRNDPDAFVRRTSRPLLCCTTTGTTGRPTRVYFSEYELHLIVALSAMSHLFSGMIGPDDIVQISTSARASIGNLGLAGARARIGALMSIEGLIEPDRTLALLSDKRRLAGKKSRVSFLSTYPTYLGELVECGRRNGYGPGDFGLEAIAVGGEIVTAGLKARCEQVFGPVRFAEGYAMTETIPFLGTRCAQGHLHFDVSHGLLEVLDLETAAPARPGEPGTIVATPFPPFRETTLLLRYDTQDVVRPISRPLTCNLRHLPATTDLLGKLRLSVRHEHGWTFPRDVLEALEAVAAVPLPARWGFWAAPGGVDVEVVVREATPQARREIERSLAERGVPLGDLILVTERGQLQHPFPLRGDLRETTFDTPPDGREPLAAPEPSARDG